METKREKTRKELERPGEKKREREREDQIILSVVTCDQ